MTSLRLEKLQSLSSTLTLIFSLSYLCFVLPLSSMARFLLHVCQLQLQVGHLPLETQLLLLQRRPMQELLSYSKRRTLAHASAECTQCYATLNKGDIRYQAQSATRSVITVSLDKPTAFSGAKYTQNA